MQASPAQLRSRRTTFAGVLLGSLAAALLLACRTAEAAGNEALLDGWFAAQTNLHTWSADFIQTRQLKSLTRPLTAPGKILVSMPDRFRWELGVPAQTIALREPQGLLVIYPRLKRVERYPLEPGKTGPWRDALALLDAGFPKSRAELESRFQILSVITTNATMRLSLQPKSPSVRRIMTEILVDTDTNRFDLLATEVRFIDGSSLRSDFTNAVTNPTLTPTQLGWTTPADYQLIEPAHE